MGPCNGAMQQGPAVGACSGAMQWGRSPSGHPQPLQSRHAAPPSPQCLREAVAEHRPLVAQLQRAAARLQELSPEHAAPLQQRCREAEQQYGRIREELQRAAAMLEDALPRCREVRSAAAPLRRCNAAAPGGAPRRPQRRIPPQLCERMELQRECLERLQGRLHGCPPLQGDAAQLQERLRENGAAAAELQQMGAALQELRAQCEELRGCMQAAGCNSAADGTAAALHFWGGGGMQGEPRDNKGVPMGSAAP